MICCPQKNAHGPFCLAHCYGGLSGTPSKNTVLGSPPMSDLRFSDFAQKCGFSPLRMAQRGETRTSSHLLAMGGGSDIGGNFLKKWSFFGIKNMKFFESASTLFFSFLRNFSTHQCAAEKALCPKSILFSRGSHFGVKITPFGLWDGTRKKLIDVQDKKRVKRGGVPFFEAILGILGDFR